MKHTAFFLALAFVSTLATAQFRPQAPDSLAVPFALAGDTHTFVRCYYKVDDDSRKPATAYRWANDASGVNFALVGRWAYSGAFSWSNLFYTDVSQSVIENACNDTLRREAGSRTLQMAAAADTGISFDYMIWHNDIESASTRPTRLISFGDSLTDTHNLYNLSLWKLPNATTWFNGAFSNGPVWAQTVAGKNGLAHANWATGGSGADSHLVVPGVLQQVRSWIDYRKLAPNYRHARSIYTVMVGGNDLLNYGRSPADSLATQKQAVDELIADGATKIMLMNLPDITRAPVFRLRSDTADMAGKVKALNAGITAMHASLVAAHAGKVQIELFDTNAAMNAIFDDPRKHGFDNTADACVDIRSSGTLNYTKAHSINAACTDADRYIFWDLLHPTRRAHQVLGEAAARFVAEKFL